MSNITKILITGTLGSGKSTLIEQFQNRYGVYVITETARDIMKNRTFTDAATLQQTIYEEQLRREEEAARLSVIQGKAIILCDRGLVDIIAYNNVLGVRVPESWIEACQNRYNLALILDKDDITYPFPNRDENRITLPVEFRNQIDTEIRTTVSRFRLPFIDISGSIEERTRSIEGLLKSSISSIEGARNHPETE